MILNNKEWKEFNLISKELFYFDKVKNLKSTSIVKKSGKYDVVGATSRNNGNVGFLDDDYSDFVSKGNCICLIKTGQGSVGDAIYKANEFIPSNNVAVIRSTWLNEYNALFIVNQINKQSKRYSYGYIRNEQRMLQEKIMLPGDEFNKPDFKFMEEYMKEKEEQIVNRYIKYIKTFDELSKGEENSQIIWKDFVLTDVFEIFSTSSGIDKNKLINLNGDIPYITRTDKNNGIEKFIGTQKYKMDSGNVITIGLDTQTVFFQPHDFYTGQNIQILRCEKLNRYSAMFLINMLKKLMEKFSWGGNGATLSRLKRSKIMLPIDEEGNIAYSYMEQYAKKIIKDKIVRYLKYKKI